MSRNKRSETTDRQLKGPLLLKGISSELCGSNVLDPRLTSGVPNGTCTRRKPQINLVYAEICTATKHPVANFNWRNCVSYQAGRCCCRYLVLAHGRPTVFPLEALTPDDEHISTRSFCPFYLSGITHISEIQI